MKFLLIDTCGPTGSVALADDGAVRQVELAGRSSSEQLIPAIRELMDGLPLAGLDAIAVVNGPGSFTGVRVGVSAAKALAEAAGVRLIAFSRLAVLAAKPLEGGCVHAVLNAGRGEFYHGLFGPSCGRCEALLNRDQLAASFVESPARVLVCEQELETALSEFHPVMIAPPKAADALSLALKAFQAEQFADAEALDGNYLRRADAEMLARQKSHQERIAAGGL